jgi:hypothetical protein
MTSSCISRLTSSRTIFRTQTIASSTERLIVATLMSKHIGVDLISDALPFGRLWYTKPDDAIGYAKFQFRRTRLDFLLGISPACVSVTLPSSLNTRMIARCERERERYFAYATA